MNNYRAIIGPCLDAVKGSGPDRVEGGVLLVGQASHITPMAVQHKIFKPLSDQEIKILESKIGVLHPDLRRFYREMNGLNLFVVGDNIRKGAATNAVQILQLFL